jgi:hypothetical protein
LGIIEGDVYRLVAGLYAAALMVAAQRLRLYACSGIACTGAYLRVTYRTFGSLTPLRRAPLHRRHCAPPFPARDLPGRGRSALRSSAGTCLSFFVVLLNFSTELCDPMARAGSYHGVRGALP